MTDALPACPEGVTTENIRRLQKGHAMNIRRGTGLDADLLLATILKDSNYSLGPSEGLRKSCEQVSVLALQPTWFTGSVLVRLSTPCIICIYIFFVTSFTLCVLKKYI